MTQKAPRKSSRKGSTLAQLFKKFPDDETATAWIERIRWPDGATCPRCGSDNTQHPVKHKTMTHRCRSCRKWFSVRTGTVMESSRLGLQTWVIAVYLLNSGLKGQTSMKLHRDLGVTQKTAWHLAHRIRESWEDNGGSLFAGPVEADETHSGGERKKLPNRKRKERTGRGAVGKAATVGTKDRETNEVRARHVENTDTASFAGFATVYTDDAAAHYALGPHFRHGREAAAPQGVGGVTLPHPIPYQGSKRKLAPAIGRYLPPEIGTFYEPFAGSAAMTIYAACHRRASRFVIADSLAPMIALLRAIVDEPDDTASRYRDLWLGQAEGDGGYFNRVRERYNAAGDHVDLLYLICRCVKNSIRFNRHGKFTQSVDKRRLGMRPEKMRAAILGVSSILRGRVDFRVGDWLDSTADAAPSDFVYMDPPYLGTSIGRDKRYHQQMTPDELIAGLASLRRRHIPFALSYDGTTGGRSYGPPLPESLGLSRLLLRAGLSSQATLNGRREETVESLYLTPGLAPSGAPIDHGQVSLELFPAAS